VRRHWFLPETPDVLATLRRQAAITVAGMSALAAWAHGDPEQAAGLRRAEHQADGVRRELSRQLRSAFSTPIDQEDIYTLSERLDAVLTAAKNLAGEAEALDLLPDRALTDMADIAAHGARELALALGAIGKDADKATAHADAAITAERAMEKRYRAAMRDSLEWTDLRMSGNRHELYRRMLDMGEREVRVADRVWYAVVKET
jgi:uncharacterized protein Yka (UPF0111/DUF47 family)